jgi:serine/threonine protein kinase/tetratricopeptide (TPR) repeat protein
VKTERWQQINDLFQSAAGRAPNERAAFLDEASHGDERLCHDVKLLIASYERTENFIEAPAFEEAPELLTNDRPGALVGEVVGHYRIESLIGVGGMGEVYLARDDRLGRKVALKLLPEHLTTDEAQLGRLEHEARTASALNHPNILTVHEIGVDGRRHFIATEFIEGETLRAVLARGKLELREAVNIAIQVGSALAAAHKSGVLHRDIKPENIMLRPDAYVKVLDFGIAKLSEQKEMPSQVETRVNAGFQTGLIFGTPHYMSPEQARGQTVDARTDIWSFGILLFEMLAGTRPFKGKTPRECIGAVLKREPSLLALKAQQVPARIEQIVRKALRKNKQERYQSVEEMLTDLRRFQESRAPTVSDRKPQPKLIVLAASVAAVLVLVVAVLYLRGMQTVTNLSVRNAPGIGFAIPEKSIAVLPFENLSEEKANAFFADGVQDDILTKLAKVTDLKVISRTSAMQYRGKQNLRQIGSALGVSHVLEGTVRRSNGKVRINAQLVDTRTDTHVWAEEYERNLSEVFAIQSEIAQKVAQLLQVKMSEDEKLAIERAPTTDITAFDFYTRAKDLHLTMSLSATATVDLLRAADLLNEAVARDPSFFQAHCLLAHTHDLLYYFGVDHTPARLALAEAAIETAFRLRPDSGEAHLARAENVYRGYLDYDGALADLEVAGHTLPNDPRLYELKGYIERRQGRWEEATRDLEHAIDLDPRDAFMVRRMAWQYLFLRRYADEKSVLERALVIDPDDVTTKVWRAAVELDWKADTQPLHQIIESIRTTNPPALPAISERWLICALAERDVIGAKDALIAAGENNPPSSDDAVQFSRLFLEAVIARMAKDDSKARSAFTAARTEQEKIVRGQPNYGPPLCVLGLIDAGLGRKEDALREARRAVELMPVKKDAIIGALMIEYSAMIAGWVGERDLACEQLAAAVRFPGSLSYGQLKLSPFWDPLRGDPRFEKIVASLAPKERALKMLKR